MEEAGVHEGGEEEEEEGENEKKDPSREEYHSQGALLFVLKVEAFHAYSKNHHNCYIQQDSTEKHFLRPICLLYRPTSLQALKVSISNQNSPQFQILFKQVFIFFDSILFCFLYEIQSRFSLFCPKLSFRPVKK